MQSLAINCNQFFPILFTSLFFNSFFSSFLQCDRFMRQLYNSATNFKNLSIQRSNGRKTGKRERKWNKKKMECRWRGGMGRGACVISTGVILLREKIGWASETTAMPASLYLYIVSTKSQLSLSNKFSLCSVPYRPNIAETEIIVKARHGSGMLQFLWTERHTEFLPKFCVSNVCVCVPTRHAIAKCIWESVVCARLLPSSRILTNCNDRQCAMATEHRYWKQLNFTIQ